MGRHTRGVRGWWRMAPKFLIYKLCIDQSQVYNALLIRVSTSSSWMAILHGKFRGSFFLTLTPCVYSLASLILRLFSCTRVVWSTACFVFVLYGLKICDATSLKCLLMLHKSWNFERALNRHVAIAVRDVICMKQSDLITRRFQEAAKASS